MSDTLATTKQSSPPSEGKGFWSTVGTIASLAVPIIDNLLYDRRQQKQFDREDAYWLRNSEYNSASSQVARLKDAGLSPNLAYGSVDSGNMSAMPNSVSPRGSNVDPMTIAQLRNLEAQTNNINANTKNIESDTNLKEEETQTQQELQKLYGSQAGLNDAQAGKVSKEIVYLTAKFEEVQKNISYLQTLIDNINQDTREKKLDYFIKNQTKWDYIFQTEANSLMDRCRLRLFSDTYAHQVLGFKLDNDATQAYINLTKSRKLLTDEQINATVQYAKNLAIQSTDLSNVIRSKVTTKDKHGKNVYQASADMVRWSYSNRNVHFWADRGIRVAEDLLGVFTKAGAFGKVGEGSDTQLPKDFESIYSWREDYDY